MFGPIRMPATMYPITTGSRILDASAAPRNPTVAMTPTSNMIEVASTSESSSLGR